MNDINTMLKVLREARKLVDFCIKDSVCSAIYAVSGEEYATPDPKRIRAGRYLKRWVMAMISPNVSLFGWLEHRGIQICAMYDKSPDKVRERLRVTRLAWIDWMIAELEKELG